MIRVISLIFVSLIFVSCSMKDENIKKQKEEKIVIKEEPKYVKEEINDKIKEVIKDIVKLIATKDLTNLNKKYIDPKYGYYDLFKYDGYESFINEKMIYNIIEGDEEELNHILFRVNKNAKKYVVIEQEINFNCSPKSDEFYGWTGDGLYLSYLTNTYLSDMMKEANKYQKNKYSKEELKRVAIIEEYSYKIILTPEIIFYLTKFDNRWYITLFDRISTNCSTPVE